MKIVQKFVKDILEATYNGQAQTIYDATPLIQYVDKKTSAVNRGCTARRNLANLYAIYSITHFYAEDYYEDKNAYSNFGGYSYSDLKSFCNSLYGGEKLQNHGFNNRAIGEFRNKTKTEADLFVIDGGKYKIYQDYLYAGTVDIAKTVNSIIEKYIELIKTKDENTIGSIDAVSKETDLTKKKTALKNFLGEDAEARLFEIISFAILKKHYQGKTVYYGSTEETVRPYKLCLYKTGRTNANDGGIDFVLKPEGRFFQVTEVGKYDKYFLDIDKVMKFPLTFVVKTNKEKTVIFDEMIEALKAKYGDEDRLIEDYKSSIEEIITMNELNHIIDGFSQEDIADTLEEITLYFNLEMNIDEPKETDEE